MSSLLVRRRLPAAVMYRIANRAITLILLFTVIFCSHFSTANAEPDRKDAPMQQSNKIVVGAIRWDAWHGDRGVPGRAVQSALGSKEWRYRLPFFAQALSDDAVHIDGISQEVMDREIAYANAGGLDYWGFVTYNEDDAMSLAFKLYLSSTHRPDINFCQVTELVRWRDPKFVKRLVTLLNEPGYQKVLDNRPLLYLGFINQKQVDDD